MKNDLLRACRNLTSLGTLIHLSFDSKVHYRIHNSSSPNYVLSQMNPLPLLMSYLFNTRISTVLPSTPWSLKWCVSFRLPD